MQIEHKYGQQYAEIHKYEREQQILAQQWYDQRSRRYQVDQQQIEHEQRDQNWYAQRKLLARVTWQIKDQHRQEWNVNARYNQIDSVEQGFSSYGYIEINVQVLLLAAVVVLDIFLRGYGQHVPLDALIVVWHIDAHLDRVEASRFEIVWILVHYWIVYVNMFQVDEIAIKRPCAKFHVTILTSIKLVTKLATQILLHI